MEKDRIKVISRLTQTTFWVVAVLMLPIFTFVGSHSLSEAINVIPSSFRSMLPWIVIYFTNFYLFVPRFLYGDGKKWLFYLSNIILFAVTILILIIPVMQKGFPDEVPFSASTILSMAIAAYLFLDIVLILLAVGFFYIESYYILKKNAAQQKQKAAEAELVWLKSQLNPHFLFNTLNNISSLVQIDANKAQESISQFSDLLRYALYESDSEMVPISSEISFLSDYIDLMKLRCNEMTTVTKDFKAPSGDVKIAPLLFISLIENAFKHGVNARSESFVNVSMYASDHDLHFVCENSVFEKSKVDRIGSGIGLVNLQKRLDLIYPGKYRYTVKEEGGKYSSTIILKGIC